MKKNSKSILSGKGFYVALALSVAMVGAACYFAYTQTSNDISGRLESSSSSEAQEREAAEIQTDIPKITLAPHTQEVFRPEAQTEAVTEISDEESGAESEETAKPKEEKLVMPIEGEVLNEFSGGELVKSKTTGAWQTHNGVDIAASLGDAVASAGSGTVSAVDNDPLWGIIVTVDHGNGIITRYSNLNEGVKVHVGQEVSVGEEIGAVGETADIETAEKSHLHFEVIKNGSFVNPIDMIG